jgi:secondary thiamine-phosphate synthase enzyme
VKVLELLTHSREEMQDISDSLKSMVRNSGIQSGILVVQSPHTTLGLTVNENADLDVQTDMLGHLRDLIPQNPAFKHREGNSDSHIKVTLVGPSLTLLVEAGALVLGTWQGVYAMEFDGPRHRQVWVQVIGTADR